MAIIYNRFIYENGQDAAVITAIEAALAAAGWAETTSDGETLYKTALPDSNGAYGYVNLKADDGNSKIGVAVGADLGTDELGFSTMNGVQVGKRSTPGPASGSWTCVVMAFERWFIAFGLGDPEDAGSGAHESDGFLLGGGLYQPLFNLEGNHPLMAIGSQLYNSATNYGGKLFAGATTGPITATLMNTWISANLHGHQNYTNYAAAGPPQDLRPADGYAGHAGHPVPGVQQLRTVRCAVRLLHALGAGRGDRRAGRRTRIHLQRVLLHRSRGRVHLGERRVLAGKLRWSSLLQVQAGGVMKYTHSSVANVTALIAAIGADLVTEGWTAHATVVDAWTSAADTYGYRFSVLFSEDTEGNIQASTFVDTLPSDNTSPVIIGTRGSGFTASRNWSVYAYASGFMAFDQTETSSHDEGFFGAGRYAPLHAGQGYWEPERLWNLGCRVEDSATAYSLFISGGDIATTPTHRALVVSGGGTADWAEFAGS
jgi:hypothetical protein